MNNIPDYSFFVSSDQNISNVKLYSTDFQSEVGNTWLSNNFVNIIPDILNLTQKEIYEVNIKVELNDQFGIYNGSIILWTPDFIKSIPITIEIYDYIPWIQIIFVGIGVVVAFFVKFYKLRFSLMNEAREALETTEESYIKASKEKRLYGSYELGHQDFFAGIFHFQIGNYKLARKKFKKSSEYYNTATINDDDKSLEPKNDDKSLHHKNDDKSLEPKDRQTLSSEDIREMTNKIFTTRKIVWGLRESNNILLIFVSVIIGILMIHTINQYYQNLFAMNSSLLSYIGAFLLGYGSQSLVGETVQYIND